MLPLHIFEARYRAMITDCLSRDRRLAVVGLRPGYEASYEGRPAVYGVMGVGRIVQWERMPTGRFNLLLQGECRARIDRELPADTLYRLDAARRRRGRRPGGGGAGEPGPEPGRADPGHGGALGRGAAGLPRRADGARSAVRSDRLHADTGFLHAASPSGGAARG